MLTDAIFNNATIFCSSPLYSTAASALSILVLFLYLRSFYTCHTDSIKLSIKINSQTDLENLVKYAFIAEN